MEKKMKNEMETGWYIGLPKIRGPILGVPFIRIRICWGLFWGPSILGKYHMAIWGYTGVILGIVENKMETTI